MASPTDSRGAKSVGGGPSRPGQSIYSNSRCKNYSPAAIFFTIGVSLVVIGVLIALPSFPRLRQFLHIPDGHNEHLVAAAIFCACGVSLPLLALAVCVCRATPSLRKRQSADFVADAWLEGELAPAAVPAHYDCYGAGNAHKGTILMLPGAGAPRAVLRAFAEELATQQRVIVADVPGQGSLVRILFSLARCDRLLCRILEREFNLEPSTLLMRASATSAAAIGASARGGASAAAVAASGAMAGGAYTVPLPGGGQFTLNPAQLAALAAGAAGAGGGPMPAMAASVPSVGPSGQGTLPTIRERPPSIPEDRSLSTLSLAGAAGAALATPLRPAIPLPPGSATAQNGVAVPAGSMQRLKLAGGIQMSAQLPTGAGAGALSPAAIEALALARQAAAAGLNSGSHVSFGWDSVSAAASAQLSPPATATGSLTVSSPSAFATSGAGAGAGGGISSPQAVGHDSEGKRGGFAGFLGLRNSSSTAAGGDISAGAGSLNGPSRGAGHAAVVVGGDIDAETAAPLLSNEYGRGSGSGADTAAAAAGGVKTGGGVGDETAPASAASAAGPSVTVIAWGLSAYTAAYFAMRHPDVVAGIAAAGPIPDFSLTLCKRCAFAFCCSCGCNGRCCCFGTSPAPDVGPGWFPWSSSVRRLTWVAALSNLAFKSRVQTHPRCPAHIRAALLQQDVHVSVVPDLVSEIKSHRLLLSQLRLRSTLPVLLVTSRRLARATRNLIPAPAAALTRSHASAPAPAALAMDNLGVHVHDEAAANEPRPSTGAAASQAAGAGSAPAHGAAAAAAPAYQGVVVSGRSARGVRLLLETENAGDAQVRLVISHGLNDPMLPTLNPSKTRRLCAIFGAFAAASVQHSAALRAAREREARMLHALATAHAAAVAQAQADAVAHALALRKLSGASGGGGNGSGRNRSSRSEANDRDRRGSSSGSGGGSSSFSGPSSGVGSSGIGGSIGAGMAGLGLMPAHSPNGSVARGAGARSFGAVTSGGASFSTGSGTLGSLGSSGGMGASIGQGAGAALTGSAATGTAPGLASALAGRSSAGGVGGGAGSVGGSVKHSVSFPGLSFDERGQGSSQTSSAGDKDARPPTAGAAATVDAAAVMSVSRGPGPSTAAARRGPALRQAMTAPGGAGAAAPGADSIGPMAAVGPVRSVSRDTAATSSPAFAALLAAGPQPGSSVLSLGGMWPAEGMSGGGMHSGWQRRPGGSAAEWDDEDHDEPEHDHHSEHGGTGTGDGSGDSEPAAAGPK